MGCGGVGGDIWARVLWRVGWVIRGVVVWVGVGGNIVGLCGGGRGVGGSIMWGGVGLAQSRNRST